MRCKQLLVTFFFLGSSSFNFQDIPSEALILGGLAQILSGLGLQGNLSLTRQIPSKIEVSFVAWDSKHTVLAATETALKRIDTLRNVKEKEVTPAKGQPNRILASTEYFEKLYRLMNYGDSIAQKVWELLNLLPTNEALYNELCNLGGEDKVSWETLIDFKSTYKLVYSLQIVQNLTTAPPPDPTQVATNGDFTLVNSLTSLALILICCL
jgi:hypothetical protein